MQNLISYKAYNSVYIKIKFYEALFFFKKIFKKVWIVNETGVPLQPLRKTDTYKY
jgi:hypothetical protein